MKPGVYDIPADEYHADCCPEPSLSCSIAKLLVTRTPRHAWACHPRLCPTYEPEHSASFDLGSAAHALMLHDERLFEIVDAEDWRTKEAKAKRDAAREAGKIPLLTEQWERVQSMVESGRRQLETHKEASGAFTDGKPEQTLIWQEHGLWFRARLDWLPGSGDIFDDYKSTEASADPDAWWPAAERMGFDLQAVFYMRGIKALGLSQKPQFRFIVQESNEPFALSVVALSPAAIDLAEHKVARAIRLWRECLTSNLWPGYPDRTCYKDPSPWAEAKFMEHDSHTDDTLRRARPTAAQVERAMAVNAP